MKQPVITAAQRASQKFEEANSELQEFMTDNEEFMDELRRLVENFNASLKEASVTVKGELKNSNEQRMVVGRFGAVKKSSTRWDGTMLASLFPAEVSELFLKEVVNYVVDVAKLEQLIRQGELDRDAAYQALQETPPTVALMPGVPKELKI